MMAKSKTFVMSTTINNKSFAKQTTSNYVIIVIDCKVDSIFVITEPYMTSVLNL